MAPKKSSAVESVAGAIKPPITFKEFSKDPVKGLMFICIVAVGYLYVDIKMSNQDIQSKQDVKINKLEAKADTLQNQINVLIFQSAAATAKNEIVEKLNKIPQ
jgi:archaellum component FlaF (FlaF/FlaG flagellin family)